MNEKARIYVAAYLRELHKLEPLLARQIARMFRQIRRLEAQ